MSAGASSRSPAARFASVRARAPRGLAEHAAAEAWEAGACGLEERGEGDEILLIVYAPRASAEPVRAALASLIGVDRVSSPEAVPEIDWSRRWAQGLRPVVVSARLVVRAPGTAWSPAPGQAELLIEPRQAFGSGAHATTALALELLDGELARRPAECLLDVGCGSGVLALAALRLGARRALACDVDPVAAREAAENAERNGLGAALRVFAGTPAALRAGGFDLVVANLIRRELWPLLADLAGRLRPGGALVLSGLLAGERALLEGELARIGLALEALRERCDERGDAWLALTALRR
jgi:ribosomal protein L11 methyltransferase